MWWSVTQPSAAPFYLFGWAQTTRNVEKNEEAVSLLRRGRLKVISFSRTTNK